MTIKNLHQRKITAAHLAEFTQKLADLEATNPADDNETTALRLSIAHTRSYIKQFETEIADFDALTTAETIAIDSIADIGLALIRARVASGLTQAQLAERVGLHTAAINRYETNNYRTANLTRLNEIADTLDFDLAATLQRRKTNTTTRRG